MNKRELLSKRPSFSAIRLCCVAALFILFTIVPTVVSKAEESATATVQISDQEKKEPIGTLIDSVDKLKPAVATGTVEVKEDSKKNDSAAPDQKASQGSATQTVSVETGKKSSDTTSNAATKKSTAGASKESDSKRKQASASSSKSSSTVLKKKTGNEPAPPKPVVESEEKAALPIVVPTEKNTGSERAEKTNIEKKQDEPAISVTPPTETVASEPEPVQEDTGPAMFFVRSGPIFSQQERKRRIERLRIAGYHPAVVQDSTKDEKDKCYLELGRFTDMELALSLLMVIKGVDNDFYVIGNKAGRRPGETVLSSRDMDRLFPHVAGESGEDQFKLLTTRPIEAEPKIDRVAQVDESGDNRKLIVRKTISSRDRANIGGNFNEPPANTNIPIDDNARPQVIRRAINNAPVAENSPVKAEQPGSNLKEQLRKYAWDMRKQGYGVYLDDESTTSSEGVLVGMFDNKKAAIELGEELRNYGYSVNVVQEPGSSNQFYVYADPESTSREIIVTSRNSLESHKADEKFEPPANPPVDSIINLMRTRPK